MLNRVAVPFLEKDILYRWGKWQNGSAALKISGSSQNVQLANKYKNEGYAKRSVPLSAFNCSKNSRVGTWGVLKDNNVLMIPAVRLERQKPPGNPAVTLNSHGSCIRDSFLVSSEPM